MNSLILRLRVRILKFAEVTLAVSVTGKKVL